MFRNNERSPPKKTDDKKVALAVSRYTVSNDTAGGVSYYI